VDSPILISQRANCGKISLGQYRRSSGQIGTPEAASSTVESDDITREIKERLRRSHSCAVGVWRQNATGCFSVGIEQ
jgi:hypothetical protein